MCSNQKARRLASRYTSMQPPIGTPINVRKSWASSALAMSPARLSVRIATAVHSPQRARFHSPKAAPAQPTSTAGINRSAQAAICRNPARARGFSRQNASSAVPGKSSSTSVKPAAQPPQAKNRASSVMPSGRGPRCLRLALTTQGLYKPVSSQARVRQSCRFQLACYNFFAIVHEQLQVLRVEFSSFQQSRAEPCGPATRFSKLETGNSKLRVARLLELPVPIPRIHL